MRVLLLNQFYPPDPAPTGWYLHGLAQELVRRGHDVKVLCSHGAYDGNAAFPAREMIDGVKVRRLSASAFGRRGFAGKMADYTSFYLSVAGALIMDRFQPDLVLSLTSPPYLGLLAKAAAFRAGGRHAHWIMDVYPDVMAAHGMARDRGIWFRCLQVLTRFQFLGAHTVLALGPVMGERLAEYVNHTDGATVHSIPLWSDPDLEGGDALEVDFLRANRGWGREETVFLYSGNMGLGHRFGEFLEAAAWLGRSGPRWVFSGGGKRRKDVEDFARVHPEARIEFSTYVPQDQLRAHLRAADVHLASLDTAWQGLMVPSKLQASFAAGRPVLFVGGRRSETAAWIEESGGGWVVERNDLCGLLQAIQQATDPEERHRRGAAAFEFAQKNFNQNKNCAQIACLLEGGAPSPSPALDAAFQSSRAF